MEDLKRAPADQREEKASGRQGASWLRRPPLAAGVAKSLPLRHFFALQKNGEISPSPKLHESNFGDGGSALGHKKETARINRGKYRKAGRISNRLTINTFHRNRLPDGALRICACKTPRLSALSQFVEGLRLRGPKPFNFFGLWPKKLICIRGL